MKIWKFLKFNLRSTEINKQLNIDVDTVNNFFANYLQLLI